MSDDLLHRELSRLSHLAEAAATPPPAAAVVRRARSRRTRHHLLVATIVPVMAAAVVVSVVLFHSPAHQNVDVSAPNPFATSTHASNRQSPDRQATRRPAANRYGTNRQSANRQNGKGHLIPAAVQPAVMRARTVDGVRRCVVVSDPLTSSADTSPLRSDPVAVAAVWEPSLAGTNRCQSTVTTASGVAAAKVLAAVQAAKPWSGLPTCPSVAAHPGSVDLVFSYRGGRSAVVTMTLGSCSTLTLPGNETRNATTVPIKALDPPSWVGRGLFG
jgi:hypothetical protein